MKQITSCLSAGFIAEAIQVINSISVINIPVPEHDVSLDGRLGNYSSFIQKMLSRSYEDGQIQTLRSILAWCTNYSRFYNKPIGTVSFDLVWER